MPPKPLFKREDRAKAERVLSTLLKLWTGKGYQGTFKAEYLFRHLAALSCYSDMTRGGVLHIACEMARAGKSSLEAFEKTGHAIRAENRRRLNREAKDWRFAVPLRLTFETGRTSVRLTVLGTKLAITSPNGIKKKIGAGILDEGRKESRRFVLPQELSAWQLPESWLVIDARGPDPLSAWQSIEAAYDTFRGCVEIASGLFGNTHHWPASRPVHKLALPPYCIATDGQSCEMVWFETSYTPPFGGLRSKALKVSADRAKDISWLCKIFSKKSEKDTTVGLVSDCLRIYTVAHDKPYPSDRFLHLWQCAETLTLADRHGGSGEVTEKRLAWFARRRWSFDDSGFRRVLHTFRKMRNDIVHRNNIHACDQEDANFLKMCCDAALLWIIHHVKELPTVNDLDLFYQWKNRNDLASLDRAIKIVKQERAARAKT